MAIKTYISPTWEDDMGRKTCNFVDKIDYVRWKDDRAYTDVMWLKDEMKEEYGKVFNLTAQ